MNKEDILSYVGPLLVWAVCIAIGIAVGYFFSTPGIILVFFMILCVTLGFSLGGALTAEEEEDRAFFFAVSSLVFFLISVPMLATAFIVHWYGDFGPVFDWLLR